MMELGTTLHSKGFSITIAYTFFNSPNPSNHSHLIFRPIPNGLTDRDTSSGDFPTPVSTINTNCEAPLRECLAQMMNQGERKRNEVACIIYDTLMHAIETVANHLKIPTMVLQTSGASAMVVYGSMTSLHEAVYFLLQGPSPGTPSPEVQRPTHLQIRQCRIPAPTSSVHCLQRNNILCHHLELLGLPENPTLSELQHHHQISFFPIGPLFKISSPSSSTSLLEENINCISWLNKQAQNSVLYKSLGSLAFVNETELAEMAWGLANSGQTFLWVIRPSSAPQKEVLAHGGVGGFWSRCGWNSVLESVSEGVPMICSPCFGDQKVNARYGNSVWKVGLELVGDGLSRWEIERMVKRLMGGEEWRG
ncbi:unnamed protein product [Camellia sinensis]